MNMCTLFKLVVTASVLLFLLTGTPMGARGALESGSSPPVELNSGNAAEVAEESVSLLRVTGLDPAPGAALTTAPDSIVATFNQDVLSTSVNGRTFRLVRSGGDGVFGNGNDVVIPANAIALDSPTQARFDGLLWPAVITGANGDILDGEFSGTPPSGDGTAGGDFGATFVLETAQVESWGPDIQVTPGAVEMTLPGGLSTTVPLTITNTGDATLVFSITKQAGNLSQGAREQGKKGEREKGKKGEREKGGKGKIDPELLDALDAAPDGQAAFIVYLEQQADPSTSSGQALSPAYGIQDWKARGEFVYRTLRETAQRSQKDLLADLETRQLRGQVAHIRPFFIVNAIAVTGDRSTVDALAARSDVAYLAPEPVFHIPEPLDEKDALAQSAGVEWNISKIGADRVWDEFGITGEGAVVANMTTGVDYTHPALVNQYRGTATGSHDYNWYDPTGTYPNAPGDNNGHGTHVMGIILGDDGAGNRIGVAPGAHWIAAKGCAGPACAGTDLLAAAEWLLAPCPIGVPLGDPTCDPSKRPHVVDSAWSGSGGELWFESMVYAWRAAGIFPAFAAGGSGPGDGTIGSPADYAASFATGGTDPTDTICPFSGRGPSSLTPEIKPDAVAPGCGGIRSTVPGGGYGTRNGTSTANPHTSGVVALLRAANPSLAVEELETLLTNTAVDLGPPGPDYTYGYGRIDAYAAVAAANDPVFWLSFTPTGGSVEPGSQTVVSVTLNAADVSLGVHHASLLITSNDPDEPTVTVPVAMTVVAQQPDIPFIRVSNIRDVSASVSWSTVLTTTGRVYFGTDPASTSTRLSTGLINVAHDDRGADTVDRIHHVTLTHLSPETTYYFYVVSDDIVDDNNGNYYQFTTGASLGIPGVDNVWVQVLWSDGTPAAGVLVYLRLVDRDGFGSPGRSGPLSGLTDSNGYWIDPRTGGPINLAAARTENGQNYFIWGPGDALLIEVWAGNGCHTTVQVDLDTLPPIVLSCPAPTVTSLSPSSAMAGSPAFTLIVNGIDFIIGSVVRWNGSDRPTAFYTSTLLTAEITAADIATAGTVTVTVFNPPPGGGTSDALTFTISEPDTYPDIEVTPAAVEVSLPEGQSTTVPLTIANVGDADLTFSIAKEQGSQGAGVQRSGGARAEGKKVKREKGRKGDGGMGSEGVGKVDSALWHALDEVPEGRATFFVYLKEQADLSPAYAIRDWKARGEYVYRTLRETAQRSQKELLAELRRQQSSGDVTEFKSFFIINAVAVTGGRSAVDALAARPDVAYLAPEPVLHIPEPLDEKEAQAAPAGVEWNVAQIRADQVWDDFGFTGEGVVVANMTTGVDHTHPALVNQYRGTATGSHDYNWYDPTGTYPNAPGDNNGHGTHGMGIILGDDGAGNRIGVAPGAWWIAAKGCTDYSCRGSDLLAAAEWLLAPCPIGVAPGDPACDAAKRPQVVNNSWGSLGGDRWFESTVSAWRAAGIFPAFAAGDKGLGDGTVGSPADYAASFATGATDSTDSICWFSSRGPSRLTPETKPDVTAPGCRGIRSALPGGGYGTKSGTAMASPHVAGAVALLLQANPGLTLEEIEALLASTAVDLGPQGPDKAYGYGRIDAYAAVAQASDPVPWLAAHLPSGTIPPNEQQVVTLTVKTSALAIGIHTASLVITSNDPDEPTVTVPVTLTVTYGSPEIAHIRVSNVRDVSASVSWITTRDADGRVYYGMDPASTSAGLSTGLANIAYDDRGAGIEDDVHHVTISGLTPNTTYYFYVASNDATDDNEGQYYQFITGAPLNIPALDIVWGQVFKSDGVTPAADALVYLRVLDNDGSGSPGQSGLLSGLTDSNGYWIDPQTGGAINLAAARTEDGQSYFVYSESEDAMRIEVQGATDCGGLMQVDTGDDSPAPDIALSCLNMVYLDITPGWSSFVLPFCAQLPEPFATFSASDLLEAIQAAGCDTLEISRWLPELGNWSGHLRGLPFGDFDLQPGQPYFLRSTRRCLLPLVTGVCIVSNEVITLTRGWNFVALPRTAGVMTAETACEQIAAQGGTVIGIDRWDADVGNWVGHLCGLPFGDFEMTPDEGYFIKSQADGVWRPGEGAGEQGRKGEREKGNTATRDPLFPYSLIPLSAFPIVGEVGIRNIQVTNMTDRSFTVMWETERAVPGWVRFGVGRDGISPAEQNGFKIVCMPAVASGKIRRQIRQTRVGKSRRTVFSVVEGSTIALPTVGM